MAFQFQTALNTLKTVAKAANEQTNVAADAVARKATEVTGRQINGRQLKSAALRIGGIAMGFGAVMAVANIASTTVGPSVAGAGGSGGGDDPNPSPDPDVAHDAGGYPDTGDFEGNVGMFMAEHGVAVHEMTPWVTAEGDVSWE
ncbi:MAG: hypothetical protein JNG89_02195 [Planctomycetaceae bacterium]|nr:hypothetical protein [Planctomycetaceae bacterium]